MPELMQVAPAKYVQPKLFEVITGYSPKAVERKVAEGVWLEDHEYIRAPDGRILIILEGFYKWAEGRRQAG